MIFDVGSGFFHRKERYLTTRLKTVVKNGRETSIYQECHHERITP